MHIIPLLFLMPLLVYFCLFLGIMLTGLFHLPMFFGLLLGLILLVGLLYLRHKNLRNRR